MNYAGGEIMRETNWLTVIVSTILSTITATLVMKKILNDYLIKLKRIDEKYRKKLTDIIIATVKKHQR